MSKGETIFITGMSGTGKSTVLEKLASRGYRVVDTDSDYWSEWSSLTDGSTDWIWREDAMKELLDEERSEPLFLSGCKSNQGTFYPYFDQVVLLSAPAEVILPRIANRTNNDYGKNPEERGLILQHLKDIEPLLRQTATMEIDASAPIEEVVRQLEELVTT
ncbi:AAA family ATPase [Halobacillus salinus]|nr:AAA family ATPase [Halobacillus salinus]